MLRHGQYYHLRKPFLTTGLRIGGLVRLQWPQNSAPPSTSCIRGSDIPMELSTVEKNNRIRRVRLSDTCRILAARWFNPGGGRAHSARSCYLFPHRNDPGRAMGTRRVWGMCRTLFERAHLHGPHVHPHTFRHTVIQMLYMDRIVV